MKPKVSIRTVTPAQDVVSIIRGYLESMLGVAILPCTTFVPISISEVSASRDMITVDLTIDFIDMPNTSGDSFFKALASPAPAPEREPSQDQDRDLI